ncbi:nucleolar and spindle-associated protein 1-like isoform X2 [Syngnathoides biaculeatus]|uniref:nucleolar and spindle-associated protein 1-like isoform X2 n=1 Tax=Syngnathoides biaculeatus TaxID=300417 RepID=UPI002ADE2EE7|nr:nucleolar and spindle-associated protein 1-like isoform X2 [Syngnathoides biaculeatus]
MDFDAMKYAELRVLAKELGLKANMKADKLQKAIKKHFQQQNAREEDKLEKMVADVTVAEVKADESKVVPCSSSVFVNTRRGRANTKKQRVRDSDAKPDDEDGEVAPQDPVLKKRREGENEPLVESSSSSSRVQNDAKDEADRVLRVAKAPKIPRYKGQRVKKAALKPTTPNFQKLHEAHFSKMESIDDYVQRKKKTNMGPVQQLKAAKDADVSLFSPALYRKKNPLAEAKPDSKNKMLEKQKDAAFKPVVLSTRRINVRFSEASSQAKTPPRMSLALAVSTPKQQTGRERKSAAWSATRPSASFVFTGNTSVTPGTQKKSAFDLKASLARPLTYKPHTGKLKPFVDENSARKSLLADSRKNYKQHQVQTRDERHAKLAEERKAKKSNLICARRGLVMM